MAAIRLIGASRQEVRFLLGVESGMSAAVGSVLGVALAAGSIPLLARTPLIATRWFPSELRFPIVVALLLILLVPALSFVAATLGVRRLIASPLAVARRHPHLV